MSLYRTGASLGPPEAFDPDLITITVCHGQIVPMALLKAISEASKTGAKGDRAAVWSPVEGD